MVKEVNDLEIYQLALSLADEVYRLIYEWNYLDKYSIGKQFLLACDSVAANIAEGHGRYHYKDMINFLYYSRDSLEEAKCWLVKARDRSLVSHEKYQDITVYIDKLAPKLNAFINAIKNKKDHQVTNS